MSSRAFVPIIAAVITTACRVNAEAPAPARVFVEVLLVETGDADVGALGEKSFADISSSPKVTVLTNPNILAVDHQDAQLAAHDLHWTLRTDVVAHDELRLQLALATAGGGGTVADGMRASVAMTDGQRLVVKTRLPAPAGRSILAVIRPDIVRSDEHTVQRR